MTLRFANDNWGDVYMYTPDGQVMTGHEITDMKSPYHGGMLKEYYQDFEGIDLEERFLEEGGVLWRLI